MWRGQKAAIPAHGVSSPTWLPPAGGTEDDVGRPVKIHGAASRRLRGLRDRLVSGDAREVHDLAESDEGNTAAVFNGSLERTQY